ncbi:hypothetical protein [Micromonospora eburnea]|uniref:Uncharacterized protein n=1 Tax=Micromonospora eburnea TaxID=227316 RepID=A0A1C6UA78_9ACTN|nr:hypothetical protein [Micromonospora eburnea]SCL50864.1 hypothetical protein GA0070604_2228 [Micromonospora eburnea]
MEALPGNAPYARVKAGVISAVESSVWAEIAAHTHNKLSWFLAPVKPEEWADRVPRLLDVLVNGLGSDDARRAGRRCTFRRG